MPNSRTLNITNEPPKPKRKSRSKLLLLLLMALLLLFVFQQPIGDYVRLYGYTPAADIASLASQSTMTGNGRHLFYINHPAVQSRADFNNNCHSYGEKTIVLGCYHGNQRGIFLYGVIDDRLNGVEQVTAAHEMLHAAYDRLSRKDKQQVDGWLTDYYEHDLKDQRLLDTIAAYKKSEPDEVVNEMHSVFGTEAANLPAPLENYYKRYFTDRAAVVSFANAYQAEFTSREDTVKKYDATLSAQRQQIDSNNQQLTTTQADIKQRQTTMNQERDNGQISLYNSQVDSFNQEIDQYNNLVTTTSQLISEYNNLVKIRNNLALEVNELAQAINSQPSQIQTQ